MWRVFSLVVTIASVLWGFKISAQTLDIEILDKNLQQSRIGLIDEFFDRFNDIKTHPDFPSHDNETRLKNLMILFNLKKFPSSSDSLFLRAQKMMEVALRDRVKIEYGDRKWGAIASCKGTYNGKSVTFDLWLSVNQRGKDMYKWVISKAEGEIFDVPAPQNNPNNMILPDDHETNFMSLKRITDEQPKNISLFMAKGLKYDATSVFEYLVYAGLLKIEYVENLELIFTQIPGYIFHLGYFGRETSNSGWLISNFYEADNNLKRMLLESFNPDICIPEPESDNRDDKEQLYNKGLKGEATDSIVANSTSYTKKKNGKISAKELFEQRLNERIANLLDYVSFIGKTNSKDQAEVYSKHMLDLFGPIAEINIFNASDSSSYQLPVDSFCRQLFNHDLICEHMDSITVPVWDKKSFAKSKNKERIELPSAKVSVDMPDKYKIIEHGVSARLYAYREKTEDGIEWTPRFGTLYITVSKPTDTTEE